MFKIDALPLFIPKFSIISSSRITISLFLKPATKSTCAPWFLSHLACGKAIAQLGIVSKAQLKAFDIDTDVFYADINWPVVLKQLKNSKVTYREISKYPEVKRDLALLLDKTITFQQIEDIAFEVEKKILKKVVLFDVYEGKNLEPGKISYAVNFTLQDTEKTLQDKQIDNVMQRLIKAFQDKLGATIR